MLPLAARVRQHVSLWPHCLMVAPLPTLSLPPPLLSYSLLPPPLSFLFPHHLLSSAISPRLLLHCLFGVSLHLKITDFECKHLVSFLRKSVVSTLGQRTANLNWVKLCGADWISVKGQLQLNYMTLNSSHVFPLTLMAPVQSFNIKHVIPAVLHCPNCWQMPTGLWGVEQSLELKMEISLLLRTPDGSLWGKTQTMCCCYLQIRQCWLKWNAACWSVGGHRFVVAPNSLKEWVVILAVPDCPEHFRWSVAVQLLHSRSNMWDGLISKYC